MVCPRLAEWDQRREHWDVRLNACIDPIDPLQLTASNWPRMAFINFHKISLIVFNCVFLQLPVFLSLKLQNYTPVCLCLYPAVYPARLNLGEKTSGFVKELQLS